MTEPLDLRDPATGTGDAEGLRTTLEQMRRQTEHEIARLNRKLAEREYAMEQTVSSATERQAMQQELGTLRHSLGDREKTLDRITQECRRLENDLEDRHVQVDNLQQEVQRKEASLKAAQDQVVRLKRQLAEIQEHSVEISAMIDPLDSPNRLPLPPVQPDIPPGPAPQVISFSAGLISGLAVIAVAVVVFWGRIELPALWSPSPSVPSTPTTAPEEPDAVTEVPSTAPTDTPADAPVVPLPPTAPPAAPPPTLRDRLRDGSLGPTMVVLPGGSFRMGQNSMGGSDSGPEHEVRLAPFLIGAYEVTFQQYDRFVRATGRRFPDDFGWGRGERPVVGVSWSEAQSYADWLTRQSGKRYRLPSEAEWEFAAQAGMRSAYPWGFGMEPGRALCFDCGSQCDNRSTAPVGSFAPNAFGLYDTAGNALEWVADCYVNGYEGAPTDGRPRGDGDCANRVARGGAYNKPAPSLKTIARAKFVPETRLNSLGFRVAREP